MFVRIALIRVTSLTCNLEYVSVYFPRTLGRIDKRIGKVSRIIVLRTRRVPENMYYSSPRSYNIGNNNGESARAVRRRRVLRLHGRGIPARVISIL